MFSFNKLVYPFRENICFAAIKAVEQSTSGNIKKLPIIGTMCILGLDNNA